MITLRELAALYDAHGADLDLPVEPVVIGDLTLGDARPALMGTVNLSRDSSYRESVAISTESAIRKGRVQVAQGAGMVDIGAESSNIGTRRVGAAEQIDTLVPVIEALAQETVVSVETYEPAVVEACLSAGARVLNMTGREHEDAMLRLAAEHDAAVVMCFCEDDNIRSESLLTLAGDPMADQLAHFEPRLERARALGVTRVVVDPGMGFYYGNLVDPMPRAQHQSRVLAQSFRLRRLGVPVCHALPHAFDLFEDEFRTAESFFAVLASLGGTHLYRTHEVPRVRAVLAAIGLLGVN